MTAHILYLKGAACPRDKKKILEEAKHHRDVVAGLRSSGIKVTSFGSASRGFTLEGLEEVLTQNPDIKVIVANIHGNIDKEKHFLGILPFGKENRDPWAKDFYKVIARARGGKPVHILLGSCGSGNGYKDAARILPRGSSLLNHTEEGQVSSYISKADVFAATLDPKGNIGEQIMLQTLCNDYPQFNNPHLTVCDGSDPDASTSCLWDLARMNAIDGKAGFTPERRKYMMRALAPYAAPERIREAMKSLELYMRTYTKPLQRRQKGTRMVARYALDERDFRSEAGRKGIYGVMCAIGYLAERESTAAFGIKPTLYYYRARRTQRMTLLGELAKWQNSGGGPQ